MAMMYFDKIRRIVESLARPKEPQPRHVGESYKNFPSFIQLINQDGLAARERTIRHVVSQPWFNLMIGIATGANVIIVGCELDQAQGMKLEDRMGFFMLNVGFTLLFFAEMLLRQNAHGWDFFLDPWSCFDYCLVVGNCVDVVASVLFSDGSPMSTGAIRALRCMRFAKNCKGLKPLCGLYYVIQGLIESIRSMAWTGFFLLICTYTFAIMIMVIGDSPDMYTRYTDRELYFGCVVNTMLTVMQVFTLDDWSSIARPILVQAGNSSGTILLIGAIIICNFGILNLIVALMVERMAQMHKEMEYTKRGILAKVEHQVLMSLKNDFQNMNISHKELEHAEFVQLLRDPTVAFKLRMMGFQHDESESFFHLLDVDHSGGVSPEEFINGLQRVRGLAKGADICALIVFAQKHRALARYNVQIVRNVSKLADHIQERLNDVGRRMHEEIVDRQDGKVAAERLFATANARNRIIRGLDHDRHIQFPSRTDR